ncbi:CAZyme family AA4 [Aspergillus niger]|uniref:FAD-binding oxidoreductase n=1 Tax=Aspergillus lacticoffeatus (strain CBS 101883) TaxID=1450533 RepID=UPI000D7F5398|nr:FAD-linked oxidase-like protein [Aspergillus niger CBS 101883]KAI2841111.1 CAZyme family AA4 [Aspergillus niger]KAI2877390.1 CAZyme family AA4 [Aspergillus niger]KAI2930425.1 CAZyme family AA4 [Aspergillus niger]KAI2960266.1 CAZyme family AA4 [Aspergillus niger]KAI2990789.1 CAZyme family AA4 [Aspergillus niger]
MAQPTKRILPLLLEESTFDKVLDKLSEIVGEPNISRNHLYGNLEGPQGQNCYDDLWPLGNPTDHTPSGAVRPKTVNEIQQVLQIANEYKLPLWTVSRGRNLGYGGSGAIVPGSVILDLHRMDKIIEVNEEFAYAIVEPGVSFFGLYEYIQDRGYRLWPSCPALGWGSIVGNTLDRGFGYTPNGEHAEQQCGMEVVLATGEVLRTGMGALSGSPMWALYKGGYGPSVDGLFYQSNLGVVTKIGIHLTPAPACFMDCVVSVPNEEDIGALVRIMSALEREGIVQNHASIANPYRQALSSEDPLVLGRAVGPGIEGGYATNADMTKLAKEQGWGYWKAHFAIYGASGAFIDACWTIVQERFAAIPGAAATAERHEHKLGGRLNAAELPMGEIPHTGYPCLTAKDFVDIRGAKGGHIAFSPLFPPDGKQLQEWFSRIRPLVEKAGFDLFSDFHIHGRYIIGIVLVVYTPAEAARAKSLFDELLKDGVERSSVSEYRTHIHFMDEVRRHYDWGNGILHRTLGSIRKTLDPNGILSQGKSGIWTSSRPLTEAIRNTRL